MTDAELRTAILAAEWIPPPHAGWRRNCRISKRQPQPLVELIELALDRWPLKRVDEMLDEYFGDSPQGVLEYEWEYRQAVPIRELRTIRRGLLPVQPNSGWLDEEREAG